MNLPRPTDEQQHAVGPAVRLAQSRIRHVVEAEVDPPLPQAHPNPALELAPALREVRRIAHENERNISIVVVLCGTRGDPQSFEGQRDELTDAGAIVVPGNTRAVTIAAAISQGDLSPIRNGG